MAKKERQKRAARQARAAERAQREATYVENAVARGEDPEKAKEDYAAKQAAEKAPKVDKNKKPNIFQRCIQWFKDVFKEMRLVVWPTPRELRNYCFAVIGLLIAFGLAVWAVDTGITAGLVQYARLRPDAPAAPQITTTVDNSATATEAETPAAAETPAEAAAADTKAETSEASTAQSAETPAAESATTETGE